MFGWIGSKERANLAIARLEDSLKGLKSDMHDMQATNKRLELEFVELYDKVRHQLSRMARRGDLAKGSGEELVEPLNANGEPEMDPVSAAIHARRSRSFLGRSE